jgi:hypothetical protein
VKSRAPRLIEGGPSPDAVAERAVHQRSVLGETQGGVARRPAAAILERLGQVPVVQREPRIDVMREQLVDEPPVVVEAAVVTGPATRRLYPGPGHGEAVGVEAELRHELDVLRVPVIVVARHVSGVPAENSARRVGESVPDGGLSAVVGGRALDLVCRRARPEDEPGWQAQVHVAERTGGAHGTLPVHEGHPIHKGAVQQGGDGTSSPAICQRLQRFCNPTAYADRALVRGNLSPLRMDRVIAWDGQGYYTIVSRIRGGPTPWRAAWPWPDAAQQPPANPLRPDVWAAEPTPRPPALRPDEDHH